jgi:hypothetical protein
MKAQNNVTVQDQDGNSSKPLLCEVAVVTPRFKDYLNYIRESTIENEKYCWVYCLKGVQCKRFDRIEKLYNYFHLDDIDDVLIYLETHLRSNLT